MAYFDSLTSTLNDNPSPKRPIADEDPLSPTRNDDLFFLAARAHYINGAGYYEADSVVEACEEYLKALEVMEGRFEEKELIEHRARFMAFTYNRLGDMFSKQFMMDPAIICYKEALVYCEIESTSPIGIPNILYRIGKQYDKKNDVEMANSYFREALQNMKSTDNMVYRDIVASKALCDYQTDGNAKHPLCELKNVLIKANTESERLNRYLTIGGIFFYEDNYDSALLYLRPVFENEKAGLQDQAANYLYNIYVKQWNKVQSDSIMRFITRRNKVDGESKALVSELETSRPPPSGARRCSRGRG